MAFLPRVAPIKWLRPGMSPVLNAVSLVKLSWMKTVERSRTHLALTFLIHSCPALLVIVMETVVCMHCNLEEQACVKGGTPCRRSGEGESGSAEKWLTCRQVVSLQCQGFERVWRRFCGCCAPLHYLLALVLVTHGSGITFRLAVN